MSFSLIEQVPNIKQELKKDYNIDVNFERAKEMLEANDGAGNTFKATAKPVLIGTAVVGATTMIFSIIMALTKGLTENVNNLSLLHAPLFLGLVTGGAMIYWFTGASTQAVTTGGFTAPSNSSRPTSSSTELRPPASLTVKRSSRFAPSTRKRACSHFHRGVVFATLAFAFVEPFFFIGYLFSIAIFGLYPGHLHGQRRRRLGTTPRKSLKSNSSRRARPSTTLQSSATQWAIRLRIRRPSPSILSLNSRHSLACWPLSSPCN